ncbi:MAG: endolytic transglycosylase MltG, partial [Bacteroidaceae bacterium]|nr:endolytic transglycosylase MltG [Bacteroidaceae bacterium]
KETLPALFLPNTYEVYWDVSMDGFMKRMERENKSFWNKEREEKAKRTGCSHIEIATLASIVDEETANNAEKPTIARLYYNRLNLHMPLQADPTVKYASRQHNARRVRGKMLQADSPYNTYRHIGLPPGPIKVASVVGIDAVLNMPEHDYLYMCAKEDFSGTHNFARTHSEHLQNAARYIAALNAKGIR